MISSPLELSVHDKAAILAHAFNGLGSTTVCTKDDRDGRSLMSTLFMVMYNRLARECGVE